MQASDTWTAWTYLGASARANADPVVALNDDGRLAVFIVNNDNAVYIRDRPVQATIHGQHGLTLVRV